MSELPPYVWSLSQPMHTHTLCDSDRDWSLCVFIAVIVSFEEDTALSRQRIPPLSTPLMTVKTLPPVPAVTLTATLAPRVKQVQRAGGDDHLSSHPPPPVIADGTASPTPPSLIPPRVGASWAPPPPCRCTCTATLPASLPPRSRGEKHCQQRRLCRRRTGSGPAS